MNKNKISHKVLITGANSDIGFEVCKKYLESGYKVIGLCHKHSNHLNELISNYGEKIEVFSVDLSNSDQLSEFIDNHKSSLSKVNVFIHLAAMRKCVEYKNLTAKDLVEHFTTNVVSCIILTQFFVKVMHNNSWGRIVVASSIGVKFGGGTVTYAYSLTKHASEFFPNEYRKWAKNNVFINAIRVGVTNTAPVKALDDKTKKSRADLIPMKRFANPDEIASEIFHLGSINNTFITGQVVTVAGGE
jgi:3-oxoacyl-[acyl-carrier protein] reductase